MGHPSNVRALVVDDNAVVRGVVAATLAALGFEVETASDGAVAKIILAKSVHRPFDLVVSDWNMDIVDGLSLLSFVRADPHLASARFLMLTANSRTEQQDVARRAGADGYLVKPFTPDALRRKVAGLGFGGGALATPQPEGSRHAGYAPRPAGWRLKVVQPRMPAKEPLR